MTETLRQKLDLIDQWLVEDDGDGRALADILAAIRGPDAAPPNTPKSDNRKYPRQLLATDWLKHRTTSHIRRTAFPRAFASGLCPWSTRVSTLEPTLTIRYRKRFNDRRYAEPHEITHFEYHVKSACEALDLRYRYAGADTDPLQ